MIFMLFMNDWIPGRLLSILCREQEAETDFKTTVYLFMSVMINCYYIEVNDNKVKNSSGFSRCG